MGPRGRGRDRRPKVWTSVEAAGRVSRVAQWAPLPLRRTMAVQCGRAAQAIRESEGRTSEHADGREDAASLALTVYTYNQRCICSALRRGDAKVGFDYL
jgi:hypothetical protein